MKKITVLFITLISLNSFAQLSKKNLIKSGVLIGKVIDKTTNETLPYVTVVIKNKNKKIITGGITKEDGTFKIKNIPEGTSFAVIQFIGFKTYTKQFTISKSSRKIDLGTINLEEDTAVLDEVEIRAETSTIVQKIDRKVINVGKDLTSAGATASELLNNVQSVSVDSQTGALSLRGNSNVRVLVDGKPTNISTAQLLKQIPSTSIKSIELITNPSAKYNPEGMSGIINIILNKNANIGFNGSVNTGITRGENTRFNGSVDMNYKTGKVNFYTNYGYNTGKRRNHGRVTRTGSNPSVQDFDFLNDNTSHLLKLGADVYINKKNTFSVYTTQNFFDGLGKGGTKVYQNGNLIIDEPFQSNTNNAISSAYNANYKKVFDKKDHTLEFEYTYATSKSPEDATYKDALNNSYSYKNLVKSVRKNSLFNIDYSNPLSDKSKLELGGEIRINKTENANNTTQTGINNSSFSYNRKIYSAYINFSYQLNKFTMQLGSRFEQYEVAGHFVDGGQTANYNDQIFSLYPSAFFTFNPSDKNQFQLSYSRRVDRPSIQQINPIRQWSTPLVTSIGNPDLRPQFTNSFELNYTRQIKKGSITFGTFFRRVNDEISTILYKDPNDNTNTKQIKSDANFDGNNRYGFEASSNYKVTDWWRANASADFYAQKLRGLVGGMQTEINNSTFNLRISNSFTATKNLKLQIFAMYRGANQNLQFDVSPMWMVNTGASYNVLKGKGSLSFRVSDLFNSMQFKFKSTQPFVQNGKFSGESRSVYLGFNYRFGSGKNKAKKRRERDDNIKENDGGF